MAFPKEEAFDARKGNSARHLSYQDGSVGIPAQSALLSLTLPTSEGFRATHGVGASTGSGGRTPLITGSPCPAASADTM